MSFGEHLDELRVALFKAVIALALGCCLGLLVGKQFILFVQAPLVDALHELEQQQGETDYAEQNDDGPIDGTNPQIDEGLVRERLVLDAQSLVAALEGIGATVRPPEEIPSGLPIWIWREPDNKPISTGVPDVFSVWIKASFVVGAVLSSPFVFYFLWTFVAAGLYPHEKRYVTFFLPISITLFLLGATVAFYIVLKFVLTFLLGFNLWLGIEATPRINEWLSFVLILPLMFGLAFQMPLVMLFLERIGVANTKLYVAYWRYAVLVIFIVSMILTPAEPYSLLAMAGFLTPLYFGGILLCKYLPKGGGKSFTEALDAS